MTRIVTLLITLIFPPRIGELHRSTQSGFPVQYAKKMPDIESLLQVFPANFESYIEENPINLSDLELGEGGETDPNDPNSQVEGDFTLKEYVKILCVLLDIPVYEGNLTDSIHVLFTLYSEFQNNQHFNSFAGQPGQAFSPPGTGDIFMGRAGTPV